MGIQLTNRAEVRSRMTRDLTPDEDAVFDSLVRDVSALMYVAAPRIPTALPLPDAVIGVASRLVIEGLALSAANSTAGIAGEALGGYSVQYDTSDGGGLSLTQSMTDALRPWARPRIGTVQIDPSKAVAI